jgi:hypothetical protein
LFRVSLMPFSRSLLFVMLAIAGFAGLARSQTAPAKNPRTSAATNVDGTSDPCTSNLNSVCALVDSSVDRRVNADVLQLSQGALALDPLPQDELAPVAPPPVSRSANASSGSAQSKAGAVSVRLPLASELSDPVAVPPVIVFPVAAYDAEPDSLSLNALRERKRLRASLRQREQSRRDQVDGPQTNSTRQLRASGIAATRPVTKIVTQAEPVWPEHPRSWPRRRPRTVWKRTAEREQSRATPPGGYLHVGP